MIPPVIRAHLRLSLGAVALVALLTAVVPAAASAGLEYKVHLTQPFSSLETSCTGETVQLTGEMSHSVTIVVDAQGGLHTNNVNRVNVTALGADGTRYRGSLTEVGTQYFAPDEMPAIGSFPFSFRLISLDGSPNLTVRGTWRITVNALGEVRAFHEGMRVECTGE